MASGEWVKGVDPYGLAWAGCGSGRSGRCVDTSGERERERKRERVCVCVCEREREREREREAMQCVDRLG